MNGNGFVPGEMPIYEKHVFVRKRRLFGLLKIFGVLAQIFADPNGDIPNYWRGVFSELRIHHDKLILDQFKRTIIGMIKIKHGEIKKTFALNSIGYVSIKTLGLVFKYKALCFSCGGQEFQIPFGDDFDPIGVLNNIKLANPGLNIDINSMR